jgi:hypothetical protein
MDYLYSSGRKRCDPRYCRTHAKVAQLFAANPSSGFNAAAWSYVAKAWNDLADLKELIGREKPPLNGAYSTSVARRPGTPLSPASEVGP